MLFNIILLLFLCATVCVNSDESIICYKTVSHLKIERVDNPFVDNKIISFWVTKKVKTCCEGYLPVNVTVFTQNLDILCDPICVPACSNRQFCEKPGKCSCYPGYKENTNATTTGKICTPICRDCDERYCVGPNVCAYPPVTRPNHFANIFRTTTIKPAVLTTTLSGRIATTKASYTVDCQNCTTPSERNSTVKDADKFARILLRMAQGIWNRNKSTSSTTTVSSYRATSKTYLNDNKTFKERNSVPKAMDSPRKPQTILYNTNSTNMTRSNAELKQNSWMEANGVSVLLPVISVLTAVSIVMLLLIWHRTPLMVCLRARYYVVDDHLPKNSDQQVSYTKNNQITILKKTELVVEY